MKNIKEKIKEMKLNKKYSEKRADISGLIGTLESTCRMLTKEIHTLIIRDIYVDTDVEMFDKYIDMVNKETLVIINALTDINEKLLSMRGMRAELDDNDSGNNLEIIGNTLEFQKYVEYKSADELKRIIEDIKRREKYIQDIKYKYTDPTYDLSMNVIFKETVVNIIASKYVTYSKKDSITKMLDIIESASNVDILTDYDNISSGDIYFEDDFCVKYDPEDQGIIEDMTDNLLLELSDMASSIRSEIRRRLDKYIKSIASDDGVEQYLKEKSKEDI